MDGGEGVRFFGQGFVSYSIEEDVEGFPVEAEGVIGKPVAVPKRHTESVETLAR